MRVLFVVYIILLVMISTCSALLQQHPDSALTHNSKNETLTILDSPHVLSGEGKLGEGTSEKTGTSRAVARGIQNGDISRRIGRGERVGAVGHGFVRDNHSNNKSNFPQLLRSGRPLQRRKKVFIYGRNGRRRYKGRQRKRRRRRRRRNPARVVLRTTKTKVNNSRDDSDKHSSDERSETTDAGMQTTRDRPQGIQAGRSIMNDRWWWTGQRPRLRGNLRCGPGPLPNSRIRCRRMRRRCNVGKGGKCVLRSLTRKAIKTSLHMAGGYEEQVNEPAGSKPGSDDSPVHPAYEVHPPKEQPKPNVRSPQIKRSSGRFISAAPRNPASVEQTASSAVSVGVAGPTADEGLERSS